MEQANDVGVLYHEIKEMVNNLGVAKTVEFLNGFLQIRGSSIETSIKHSVMRIIFKMIGQAVREQAAHCGVQSDIQITHMPDIDVWGITQICPVCKSHFYPYKQELTLRKIRELKGLTVKDVAELSGIQERTIKRWEIDCSGVSREKFMKLLKLYQVSADHVYIGPENKKAALDILAETSAARSEAAHEKQLHC